MMARFGNLSLDKHSADLLNFGRSQTSSLASRPKFSKNNESHTENPSVVLNGESKIDSSLRDSQGESKQSKQNSCDSTLESRPLRGAKNRIQGCSSATADFSLEAEKRGSPPKSEKAAAFWRVGGAGRGVQPFLRKEKSDSDKQSSNNVFVKIHFLILLAFITPNTILSADEFKINRNHAINIVSENDAYFEPFIKSDEYYTAGHFVSYLSPEFADSPLNKIAGFAHLYDKHFTRFAISLNQELYTPDKKYDYNDGTIPLKDDILFGAGLYANLSFISRTRDFMEQFSLDLGLVGPKAFGKQVQNGVHRLTNNGEARGWDYYGLKSEILVNLHYGFIYRWVFIEDFFDVLPQFQLSLGNAYTALNAGLKFRVGYGIRNDFGMQKLKSRIAQNIVSDGLKIYAVFGVSGSIVGRDMFVEGNTGKSAPKSGVKINRFLYEIELGAMIGWKYLSFGYIYTTESPRFREQNGHHKYGSLRLEIMF